MLTVLLFRSGQLCETSWALDTLNILLYDDNSVAYFGLSNMPGLLEALLEHWRASLKAVFGLTGELELTNSKTDSMRKRKRERQEGAGKGLRWYDRKPEVLEEETPLGQPDSELLRRGEKVRVLHCQAKDFTTEARFSDKDFQVNQYFDLNRLILIFACSSTRMHGKLCLCWMMNVVGTIPQPDSHVAKIFGLQEGEQIRST